MLILALEVKTAAVKTLGLRVERAGSSKGLTRQKQQMTSLSWRGLNPWSFTKGESIHKRLYKVAE